MFFITSTAPAFSFQRLYFAGFWYSSCSQIDVVSGNPSSYPWALVSNPLGGCNVIFVPSGTDYGLAGNIGYEFFPSCSSGTLIGNSCLTSTSVAGFQFSDYLFLSFLLLLLCFAFRAGFRE